MESGVLASIVALSGGALAATIVLLWPDGLPATRPAPRPPGLRRLAPLLALLGERLARLPLDRLRAPVERLRVSAGEPLGLSTDEHLALSMVASAACLSCAAPLGTSLGLTGLLAVGMAGALYPIASLRGRARKRLLLIDRSLAHVNDLLVLSLEAGLDLVGAMRGYVTKARLHLDPLATEMTRVLKDLDLGSTRKTALLAMASRAPSDAVKGFVTAVVQAEQRGTPLAQALRIQSVTLRTARSQRIEACAGRAAVLVLLPLLLIFAATVLLVFGGVIVRAVRGELL